MKLYNDSSPAIQNVTTSVFAENCAPPLDRPQLLERCMGNDGLAQKVLERFREGFQAEVDELIRAAYDADQQTVALVAHRLKGSAASVAAEGIRAVAERIELEARQHDLERIPDRIEELQGQWSRLEEFIDPTGALPEK